MRGKGHTVVNTEHEHRITPAYAGKSFNGRVSAHRDWDHPRVCGEKLAAFSAALQRTGSPPRMRGKAHLPSFCANSLRITPAYAGKSIPFFLPNSRYQDHPRVCGEKLRSSERPTRAMGSPPRMRGKVHRRAYHKTVGRITPAYAGKSVQLLYTSML